MMPYSYARGTRAPTLYKLYYELQSTTTGNNNVTYMVFSLQPLFTIQSDPFLKHVWQSVQEYSQFLLLSE